MFYVLSAEKNNPTILKEKQHKKFPKNSWKANHLCDKVNAVDIILLSERELELTISFVLQVWRPDNELKVSSGPRYFQVCITAGVISYFTQ